MWRFDGPIHSALVDYRQWYFERFNHASYAMAGRDAKDYTPNNQSVDLGNDDQAYWGLAALDAELGFPNPPASQPQWLALAQAVHHDQADVRDSKTCGGGMRWQIYYWNTGWDYKNVQSNGGFFQLSARLARYTGICFRAKRTWHPLKLTTHREPDLRWLRWEGLGLDELDQPVRAVSTWRARGMGRSSRSKLFRGSEDAVDIQLGNTVRSATFGSSDLPPANTGTGSQVQHTCTITPTVAIYGETASPAFSVVWTCTLSRALAEVPLLASRLLRMAR